MNKNNRNIYGGVVVPMVSPLTPSSTIDSESIEKLINHIISGGGKPFVLGTTGESPSLSKDVRNELVKISAKVINKREILFAGISNTCFSESLEDAENFAKFGADILVATPPSYFPLSSSMLINYFEKLADSISLPLMIYNMPSTTNISISIEVIEKLSQHSNIIGLKDSERDVERIRYFSEKWENSEDFVFLTGWAACSAWALEVGAAGIVPSTANLTPKLYKDLFDLSQKGEFEASQELQKLTDSISLLYQKDRILSESLSALKALLSLKGLCTLEVAMPFLRMEESQEKEYLKNMKVELEKLNIL